jgi:hypothetical protein
LVASLEHYRWSCWIPGHSPPGLSWSGIGRSLVPPSSSSASGGLAQIAHSDSTIFHPGHGQKAAVQSSSSPDGRLSQEKGPPKYQEGGHCQNRDLFHLFAPSPGHKRGPQLEFGCSGGAMLALPLFERAPATRCFPAGRPLRQFHSAVKALGVVGEPHVVTGVAIHDDLHLQPATGRDGLVGAVDFDSLAHPG